MRGIVTCLVKTLHRLFKIRTYVTIKHTNPFVIVKHASNMRHCHKYMGMESQNYKLSEKVWCDALYLSDKYPNSTYRS